ncbi:hypothetical protein V8E51_002254 [Hyaloscypha variabilis]
MNLPDIMDSVEAKPPPCSRGSQKLRGGTWSSCKDEIYRVYMTERSTLSETMEIFERDFGLKACTRTWRTKLKEWKFEKYLTDKEKSMGAVTTKKKGLETNGSAILHEKRSISPLRPASIKRRKNERVVEVTLQDCATSQNLTHDPPLPAEKSDLAAELDSHGVSNQLHTMNGSVQNNNGSPVNCVTSIELPHEPYRAALRMFKTVTNDSSLFIAAIAAGLVRILVRNLEKELQQDLQREHFEGKPTNFLWWCGGGVISGTDVWCDTCLNVPGARVMYGTHTCNVMIAQRSSKTTGSYHTVLNVTRTSKLFVKLKITTWNPILVQSPLRVELQQIRTRQDFVML